MKKSTFLFFTISLSTFFSLFSQSQILLTKKKSAELLNSPNLLDQNNKQIYIHEIYRNDNIFSETGTKGIYFVFSTPPLLLNKSTKEKFSSSLIYVDNQNENEMIDFLKISSNDCFFPYYENQSKFGNEYLKFDSYGRAFISVEKLSSQEYGVIMFTPQTQALKFFPLPHSKIKVFDFEISDDGKTLLIQSQDDSNNWQPRNLYIYDTTTNKTPEQFFEHGISNISQMKFKSSEQSFYFTAYYDLEPELCGTYIIRNKNGIYSKETTRYFPSSKYGKDFVDFEHLLLYKNKYTDKLYAAAYQKYNWNPDSQIYELQNNNDTIEFTIPVFLQGITIHSKPDKFNEALLAQGPIGIRINSKDEKIYSISRNSVRTFKSEEDYKNAVDKELLKAGRFENSSSENYIRIILVFSFVTFILTAVLIIFILLYKKLKSSKPEQKQILQIQEEEKAKISRDIHDTVVQDLRAIRVQAESLQTQDSLSQKRLIDDITNCIVKMRNICYNLTPAELATHKDGDNSKIELISIIDTLCRQFYTKTKIPCSIQIEENLVFPTFTKEVSTNIVRVFQEILNNIEKHSYATKTSVLIRSKTENEKKYLIIFVIDDGIGCDLNELEKSKRKNHFGIRNMKDRMKEIGAQIEFFSMPDQGMKIKLIIEIEKTE